MRFEGGKVTITGPPSLRADILRRHTLVQHPAVPSATESGELLVLDVHSDLTLRDVFARCRDDKTLRFTYTIGASIGRTVALALAALHEQADEALGAFDWQNVLVTRDGELAVILNASNNADTRAPEVSLGEKPTPASDVFAVWKSLQPLFAIVDAPAALRGAVLGEEGAASAAYLAQFAEVQAKASASRRGARYQDVPTALAAWRVLWDELGIGPDDGARKAFLLNVMGRSATTPITTKREPTLVVGTDTRWVTTPTGKSLDLRRRAACRRIVDHLCALSERGEAAPVDTETLIAIGWPGEKIMEDAAKNRLYVTLSRLRALGFDEVLEHIDGGYRILTAVRVRR